MESVGETLRRERLRQNLDLQQVARETKINQKLLEAIESDDYGKLPGGVFAKSFVRQYARLLGLDEDELAADVQRHFQPAAPEQPGPAAPAPLPVEPQIELPNLSSWEGIARPRSSSSLPAFAMVVVVMLVCSAIYAWWQRSKQPAPAQLAQQEMPASHAASPPPAQQATAQPAVQTAQPPATQPAAGPAPAPQSAERQMPEIPGGVNVSFTAAEETWISARAADGKLLYSGVLKPNEHKDVSAAEGIRVVIGNAGGVTATLNGKPVETFGPKGQVRVIQFSPGGVQIVPRKPPAVTDPDAL